MQIRKPRSASMLPALLLAGSIAGCATNTQMTTMSLAPPHPPLIAGTTVAVVPHPDIARLLTSDDAQLAANKQLVFDMWRTLRNARQLDHIDRFLAADYREHSIVMADGREGFRSFYSARGPRLDVAPTTVTDPLVTIVAEGDFVAVASVAQYLEADDSNKTYTSTSFDLFRIANGRIAEHWDSAQLARGQQLLPPERGGPAPVSGITGTDQLALLQHTNPLLSNNKRVIFDIWRHTAEAGREEMALIYLDPIYIQHNPNAVTGRAGFMEYFARRPDTAIDPTVEAPVIAYVAEGDMVVQILKGERPDPNHPGSTLAIAWFDMFRIANGRAIEHWDTAAKGEYPKIMQDNL